MLPPPPLSPSVQDQAQLHPGGITHHPGVLEAQLSGLAPSSTSYTSFDLGDVVAAVTPILVSLGLHGRARCLAHPRNDFGTLHSAYRLQYVVGVCLV